MALTFIWKKQLVWFITLLLVIVLGLTLGAMLHDVFQDESNDERAPEVKIAIPSLPFPTTAPGDMGTPNGNPPSGQAAR